MRDDSRTTLYLGLFLAPCLAFIFGVDPAGKSGLIQLAYFGTVLVTVPVGAFFFLSLCVALMESGRSKGAFQAWLIVAIVATGCVAACWALWSSGKGTYRFLALAPALFVLFFAFTTLGKLNWVFTDWNGRRRGWTRCSTCPFWFPEERLRGICHGCGRRIATVTGCACASCSAGHMASSD